MWPAPCPQRAVIHIQARQSHPLDAGHKPAATVGTDSGWIGRAKTWYPGAMDQLNFFIQRHRLHDEFGAFLRREAPIHPWPLGLFGTTEKLAEATLGCDNTDHPCSNNPCHVPS